MNLAFLTIKSNQAKVNEIEAVQDVLYSYYYAFDVKLEPDETDVGGTLELVLSSECPQALSVESIPDPDEYPSKDEWYCQRSRLLTDRGYEGFLTMLAELAPYLESPLTIIWWSDLYESEFFTA